MPQETNSANEDLSSTIELVKTQTKEIFIYIRDTMIGIGGPSTNKSPYFIKVTIIFSF